MLTRAALGSGALTACLRTLAALQQASLGAQWAGQQLLPAGPGALPPDGAAPLPQQLRSLRAFSLEAAAAAVGAADAAAAERGHLQQQQHHAQQQQQQQQPPLQQQRQQQPEAEYLVQVVTGDVRGAGSAAPAVIVLIGEGGESDPHTIGSGSEENDTSLGFERATRQTYRIHSKDLGQLRRLYVRQLPSPSTAGGGWYLDRIEVTGPGGEHWNFPCASWLGKSDAGGEGREGVTERTLLPVDLAALSSFEARQFVNLNPLFAPIQATGAGMAVPHPEKVAAGLRGVNKKGYGYGGEDSYFYASNRNGVFAMGVSDGVYAWREKGIDAGAFSQKLMEYARLSVSMGTTDVLRVVQYASRRVQRERIKGSATCCIVLVDLLQGRMASANLGDSGIMILGPQQDSSSEWPVYIPPGAKLPLVVKYRSPQQEHSFGRPYQLGHHEYADQPDDAMLTTMPVGPGDVIVMGSDGLYDNVSEEEIRAEVQAAVHAGQHPSAIVQRLQALAFAYSLDKLRETPYSLGASEAFDMVYSGGKADDITVLVAVLS